MKWNIDPEIFRIGPLAIRYYSLMFVIGFVSMEKFVQKIFVKNQLNPEIVSKLTVYIITGTFIGARLAHCFFYNPGYYLSNPFDIIKVWEGGLASHGGYVGVLVAVTLFLKKYPQIKFRWLMDAIVGPCLFVGGLIRIGNFFNSEIIGHASDLPWAITFEAIDNIPRHPAQLYESIGYFLISFTLMALFKKKDSKSINGNVLATAIVLSFSFRFFVEFFKDNQSTISENFAINMGQILSLVFIAFGLFLFSRFNKEKQ